MTGSDQSQQTGTLLVTAVSSSGVNTAVSDITAGLLRFQAFAHTPSLTVLGASLLVRLFLGL